MRKLLIILILLLGSIVSYSQAFLKGIVTDKEGISIENATIVILETRQGVVTNKKGAYKIKNLTPKAYFVQISYVGYRTQIQKIRLKEGENQLNVKLTVVKNELQEVVVSGANQRLEKIQKTPVSISAITTKEIENLQINQISELNSIAPNFKTYDDGATGGFTLIASRGLSTIDNHPVVGFYIDDIPYTDGFSFPLTLQDVSQIEVLRGPQGTLYGRNSLAGVVRITTKKPVNNVTGYLKVGAGNLKAKNVAFAFNAPLVNDKLFLRASTNIYNRDGYTTNLFLNKKIQNRKSVDANIRLKYLASDKLTFDALYNVFRKESDAYAFLLLSPKTTKDYLKDPYKVNFDVDANRVTITQNAAFKAKLYTRNFDFTAITSYQHTDQTGLDDYDYTPFDYNRGDRDFIIKNITQEFKLASTLETKLKWNLGALLYRIETDIDGDFTTGVDGAKNNPDIPFPFKRTDIAENIQKGVAVYGQASYSITDELTVTGGIRFDYEKSKAAIDRTYSPALYPRNFFKQDANFKSFSPKVSVSYQFSDKSMLFANVAKGYRPGGINNFVLDKNQSIFDPETTINYELGIKNNVFKNRLKLNFTGFYISYKDQQIYNLLTLDNPSYGFNNIGESTSFGLELESKILLTKGLTFGVNLGYLNTTVEEYIERLVDKKKNIIELDWSGNTLPFAPDFNGNANLQWIQPINKNLNIEALVDYMYQSAIHFDIQNATEQEAYGLLNGKIGITTRHIDFYIWGKNITDKAYFGYGYGISGYKAATYSPPQTYGANAIIKF